MVIVTCQKTKKINYATIRRATFLFIPYVTSALQRLRSIRIMAILFICLHRQSLGTIIFVPFRNHYNVSCETMAECSQ